MEERPSRIELIKILITDRDHHFSHPHDVSVKFFYSLGGTISTILIAFFIKNSESSNLKDLISENLKIFGLFGITIVLGYILIFWGLSEHTTIHTEQRKRIESAIEYLVATKPEEFDFNIFWEKYGHKKLKYNKRKKSRNSTKLIVAEPDMRNWLSYHDRKVELGIVFIFIGVIGLIISLFT
jgi:hypothetical protein